MDGGEDGDALIAQVVEERDKFSLAANVKVLGGLVEQQEPGLLGKAESDLDPLALAAREFVEDAFAEGEDVGLVESFFNCEAIFADGPAQQAEVRGAALLDDLLHGEVEGNIELLRDERDEARALFAREGIERLSFERDDAGRWGSGCQRRCAGGWFCLRRWGR